MKQACARDIYNWVNEIAPFDTAEDFDNVGLLIGAMDRPVSRVLVALDATPDVVREAKARCAELILTHHPLMFNAIKAIRDDSYEGAVIGELIRNKQCLIAAHTNLDKTSYSGSAALARRLGLVNIRQEGFVFAGDLPGGETRAAALAAVISAAEGEYINLYGDPAATVTTLAIAGGAADLYYPIARQMGAQALLTGEVRHHNALSAVGEGFVLLSGGHFGTEAPLVPDLTDALQNAMNALQLNVAVIAATGKPYGRPAQG